jgi:hypothetical protein
MGEDAETFGVWAETMTEDEKEYVALRWGSLSEEARRGLTMKDLEELFLLDYPAWQGKMSKRPTTYEGPRLAIPDDKSVIAEVREAIKAFPGDAAAAAKSIGMGNDNYRFIRRLILLEARPFLSRDDRDKIRDCFEIIDRERRVKPILAIGRDVIDRNWATRKKAPYVVKTDRKRFDQTIIAIGESGEATINMTLPDEMSREEVAKTIGKLSRSVELIGRLIQRLVGEASEESEDV